MIINICVIILVNLLLGVIPFWTIYDKRSINVLGVIMLVWFQIGLIGSLLGLVYFKVFSDIGPIYEIVNVVNFQWVISGTLLIFALSVLTRATRTPSTNEFNHLFKSIIYAVLLFMLAVVYWIFSFEIIDLSIQ